MMPFFPRNGGGVVASPKALSKSPHLRVRYFRRPPRRCLRPLRAIVCAPFFFRYTPYGQIANNERLCCFTVQNSQFCSAFFSHTQYLYWDTIGIGYARKKL